MKQLWFFGNRVRDTRISAGFTANLAGNCVTAFSYTNSIVATFFACRIDNEAKTKAVNRAPPPLGHLIRSAPPRPTLTCPGNTDTGAQNNPVKKRQKDMRRCKEMADREGFEPSIRFHVYTLSRRAPSTTRPPVHPSAAVGHAAGWERPEPFVSSGANRRTGGIYTDDLRGINCFLTDC